MTSLTLRNQPHPLAPKKAEPEPPPPAAKEPKKSEPPTAVKKSGGGALLDEEDDLFGFSAGPLKPAKEKPEGFGSLFGESPKDTDKLFSQPKPNSVKTVSERES